MCLIDVRLHLLVSDERVIDIGVYRIGVMNVDDRRTRLFYLVDGRVFVIETVRPLPVGVDRMERRDQQREVVIQQIALLHCPRAAVALNVDRFSRSVRIDIDTAFPAISP